MKELNVNDTYRKADISHLKIKTSADIEPLEGEIIKQERAEKAIEFGLGIKKFGYNLFISGGSSARKRSYLKSTLTKAAKNKSIPNDIVLAYNFEENNQPYVLPFKAGEGIKFQTKIKEFVSYIEQELKEYFQSSTYQKRLELLLQSFEEKHDDISDEFSEKFLQHGYGLYEKEDGNIILIPVNEQGDYFVEEEYAKLSEEERLEIVDSKKDADLIFIDYSHQQNLVVKEKEAALHEQDEKLAAETIAAKLEELLEEYKSYNTVITYLKSLHKDILENVEDYKETPQENQQQNVIQILTGGTPKRPNKFSSKYRVNLLVDNKHLEHAPVVFVEDFNPLTFFGNIEYKMEGNVVFSDFTSIVSGDLIKANGGYLVMNVEDLFKYHLIWDKFKTTLLNKNVKIGNQQYRDLIVASTLNPVDIPIDVKVILVGSYNWHSDLSDLDPDFQNLFKIHAIFEGDTTRNKDTEMEFLRFISKYIKRNSLKEFDSAALEAIVEYSSRIADNQNRLILNYNKIYRILDEADIWAELLDKKVVDLEAVEKAFNEMHERTRFVEEGHSEAIQDSIYLIETTGAKIGEINALSVSDYGDFSVGKPARLTANTYRGEGGVISIDRNVKMSGKIHDKAVDTIRGFLGSQFAKDNKFSLVANVTFEQNYGGIEGDSATTSTLLAILSDLSGVPFKQSLAVTGSMNQKGEIQVVGGVNDKIEGFFRVCKLQGLTGDQGVVIPEGNIQNLMLSKEVREAIEKGVFHIYPISRISEGIDLFIADKTITYQDVYTRIIKRNANISPKI